MQLAKPRSAWTRFVAGSSCVAFLLQLVSSQQVPLGAVAVSSNLTHDLLAFHKNITQIESISGNEKDVGEWLSASLEAQGYNVERQYIQRDPDRFNVYAWPGQERDAPIILSSHIDTVPPFLPYNRTGPEHNKTISGRGSVDAKGSVATQVIAVNKLLSAGTISPDDVALLYVVGEEVHGDGMRAANDLHLHPRAVIFGEPTEGKLVAGHKGITAFTVHAKGRAAHSGYPWLGRSANEILVRVLAAIMDLGEHLPRSDKYGTTTFNLGTIAGGVAGNVVAESASASITVRIAASTPKDIREAVTKSAYAAVGEFLDENATKVEDLVELEWASNVGYAPVDIDADVPGFEVITVNYGTDVHYFKRVDPDQKRYLYGPGTIFVAHSDHEALPESDLFQAVHDYQRIILFALGKEGAEL